jgi:hypothetical protein
METTIRSDKMNKTTPVYKDGKILGHVRSWKAASRLLGASAVFARRECGWCWTV